jgi:hypothetical protein
MKNRINQIIKIVTVHNDKIKTCQYNHKSIVFGSCRMYVNKTMSNITDILWIQVV